MPGIFLIGLQYTAIRLWSATELLNHRLDQITVGYLALYYVIAAVVFWFRYKRAESALERQQLKWLTRGTLLAVTPFTIFYVIPYLADRSVPSLLTKLAGLSLVILPLTFSWAIVRYRLMDVDLIFKRGVTYTLATAVLASAHGGSRDSGRDGAYTAAVPAYLRTAGGHRRLRTYLRSVEARDSGKGGPHLRPETVRLSRDAGGLRPRTELADRSSRAARFDRRTIEFWTLLAMRVAVLLGQRR